MSIIFSILVIFAVVCLTVIVILEWERREPLGGIK